MAKTIFSSGVIVTSQWLNGARQIVFDGQDLDWHYDPLDLNSLVTSGPNGLDSRYVQIGNLPSGLSVQTFTYTTASLAPGAFEDFELSIGKLYNVLQIETDFPAWLRVYGKASARTADVRITPGLPFPVAGSGYFTEVATTIGNPSIFMSPIAAVQQETTDTYFSIQNNDASAREITVTISAVVLVS